MSLLEIIKVAGFATGAVLYFYLGWLISRRGNRVRTSRPKFNLLDSESIFTFLAICMGAWFLGNLLNALQVLALGSGRLTFLLRVWDSIAVIGIALVPSAMLHSHITFWNWLDGYRVLGPNKIKRVVTALYIPMLALPYTIYRVSTGEYRPFLVKLGWVLIPYSVWFVMALWTSAAIDWWMKDRLYEFARRERTFLKRIAVMLFVLAGAEFVVVGIRPGIMTDYLWVTYILLSLLPPVTVAHYIYRYHPFELVIKDSILYAAFAVVFIIVYAYGIRYLGDFARQRDYNGVLIEALLILALVAVASPLVRLMDRTVRRLFAREIGLYRDVVRQVTSGAAGFGELSSLVPYLEETIKRGIDLASVRIVPLEQAAEQGPEHRLAQKLDAWQSDVIEGGDELASLDSHAAYALRREGRLTGLMLVAAEPHTFTSEKRSVLEVLAGQVGIEIENCRLVEEKVRLERELASRERLAMLGQMAATVAHEVKNPLSSIKSIAQVMREDQEMAPYEGDLKLIIGEVDRLNRSVSQLLSFSRPSRDDRIILGQNASLKETLDALVALLISDANERRVRVAINVDSDFKLTEAQSACVRDAVSNLVLNAIQASPPDTEVKVEAHLANSRNRAGEVAAGASAAARALIVSVIDQGPGIDKEVQRRIFEPFYTTKPRGTGLGLAIVQRRAAELGGAIQMVSPADNGHGTIFQLIVPVSES